jgi:hypothetical protein
VRAQLLGLRFELLDREAADERRVVHEAVFVAAGEIPRDRAAGGLLGGDADERAETRTSRDAPWVSRRHTVKGWM